jgi:hypothetical protein
VRTTILALANGLTVAVNAAGDTGVHGPRLYASAEPLGRPLEDWTRVDLARHHDEAAVGRWWAGKWQYFAAPAGGQGPAQAGMCGGGGVGGESLCTSTGVVTMVATGPSSVLVCYDQRDCPFESSSSAVWCVDVGLGV